MKPKKKDKHYIPILDQPVEELKKPIGEKVDFNAAIEDMLQNENKTIYCKKRIMKIKNASNP